MHHTSIETIYALTDLTLLDEKASTEALKQLVTNALTYRVAAVCVYPQHLSSIPTSLQRATVLNFPTGNESQQTILQTLTEIIQHNSADEIDYVFPYQAYLAGRTDDALAATTEIAQYCQINQKKLKIILETGAFASTDHLYTLSLALINIGCDFLKTSTGKIETGATLEAATAMLSAICDSHKKNTGIKISGGIRTLEQAQSYIDLAEKTLQKPATASWFRIGTSGFKTNAIVQGEYT